MPLKRETGRRERRALELAGQSAESLSLSSSMEASAYIATMTGELMRIATSKDLSLLAYFLDMARVEAESIAREGPRPEGHGPARQAPERQGAERERSERQGSSPER